MNSVSITQQSASSESTTLTVIANGGAINFLGNIIGTGLNIVLQLLMARTLGANNVGTLVLVISISAVLTNIAIVGLDTAVLRFVATYLARKDYARAIGAIIAGGMITISASFIIAIGLFFAAPIIATRVFVDASMTNIFRIFAVSLPFTSTMIYCLAVTQSLKRMKYQVIVAQIFVPLLKILGLLFVIYLFDQNVIGVAVVFVMISIAGALLALGSVWRLRPLYYKTNKYIFPTKEMLSFSWPILAMDFVDKTRLETQTMMLGIFMGSTQVGIYYVSLRMAGMLAIPLLAISPIFGPVIAEIYSRNNRGELENIFRTVTKWSLTLSLPAFLVLTILGYKILLLFGAEFTAGVIALGLLAVGQLINVITGPVGQLLIMSGRSRLNLFNALLMLLLNLSLGIWLVPQFNIVGAAISASLPLVVVNFLRLLQVHFALRIKAYSVSYWKPLLAASVSAIGLRSIQNSLSQLQLGPQVFAYIILLLIIYVGVLLALGLDASDKVVLNHIKRRLSRMVTSYA